jgi:hypothetical protein
MRQDSGFRKKALAKGLRSGWTPMRTYIRIDRNTLLVVVKDGPL